MQPAVADIAGGPATGPVPSPEQLAQIDFAKLFPTGRPEVGDGVAGLHKGAGDNCRPEVRGSAEAEPGKASAQAAESAVECERRPPSSTQPQAAACSRLGGEESRSAEEVVRVDSGLEGRPATPCRVGSGLPISLGLAPASIAPLTVPLASDAFAPDGAASVFPRPEKVREDACPEARVKHNRACSPRRQPQEKTPPDFSAGLSGLTSEVSFCSWVSALPRLLRSAKTPFSHFMLSTLPLCRDSTLAVSSALFPLPVPYPGLFRQQARCSSSRAYLRLCQRKCVHFAIMALNYLRAGCKHVSLEGLRRPSSPIQVQAYARIGMLVRACSRHTACAGRKGLRTAARLQEVLAFMSRSGLCAGMYAADGASPGESAFVPHTEWGVDVSCPIPSLRSRGFLAPMGLLQLLSVRTGPSFSSSLRFGTCHGLLGLTVGPLPDRCPTRVFGAFKAPGKQRQIGDRRGVNSLEARVLGPSRWLPAGPLLALLHVPRHKCLVGSLTDRKDFYHQAAITQERATSNAVGRVFKLGDFEGTAAHADFIAALAEEKRRPRSKGDFSEVPRRALLCDPGLPVHPTLVPERRRRRIRHGRA